MFNNKQSAQDVPKGYGTAAVALPMAIPLKQGIAIANSAMKGKERAQTLYHPEYLRIEDT